MVGFQKAPNITVHQNSDFLKDLFCRLLKKLNLSPFVDFNNL